MSATYQRAAIAVVTRQDRWLVGPHDRQAWLGELWEFPGGKVELNETPAEAAQRECREETGLSVRVVELLDHYKYAYPYVRVELWFFLCQLIGDIDQPPTPPYRFVTLDQLLTLEMPAANQTVLERLQSGNTGPESTTIN